MPAPNRHALRRWRLFREKTGPHRGAEHRLCARRSRRAEAPNAFLPDLRDELVLEAGFASRPDWGSRWRVLDPSFPAPTRSVWEESRHSRVAFAHQLDPFVRAVRVRRQLELVESHGPTRRRRAPCAARFQISEFYHSHVRLCK